MRGVDQPKRRRRTFIVAAAVVAVVVAIAWFGFRSPIYEGATWDDVVANPDSVSTDLSDSQLALHSIEAGGLTWWECTMTEKRQLERARTYRGRLRIEKKVTPGGGLSGSDRIVFETGGMRVRFGAYWRSC